MTTAVRQDPVILDAARHRIEDLVCDTPGGREGELSFDKPWEVRAFAMAVAGHQNGQFAWDEFQRSLVASIGTWEGTGGQSTSEWSYYVHWVNALESVMTRAGALPASSLDDRTSTVLSTQANANHHEAHHEPIAIDPARARTKGPEHIKDIGEKS